MFDNMYFTKKMQIDSKNRIYLPNICDLDVASELAIARLEDYYALFLLSRINKIVDDLRRGRMIHLDDETSQALLNEINFVFNAILKVSKMDKARRIILPSEIKEDYGSEVIIQGRKDHIALFSEDSFQKYQSSLKKSKILG